MTQKTEAQRLADALAYCDSSVAAQAAAELRRLDAQARELVRAVACTEKQVSAMLQAAPAAPAAENIREGAPYDNPAFEQLSRDMGVWGTPQAALCAQFWMAAPVLQPLTEEQAVKLYETWDYGLMDDEAYAAIRAVERAHGIGAPNA